MCALKLRVRTEAADGDCREGVLPQAAPAVHEHHHQDRIDFLGYRVSARGESGDIEEAWRFLDQHGYTRTVQCLNPHSIVEARRDREFQEALQSSSLLLPDGIGVVMGARLLVRRVLERVPGFEFFIGFTRLAALHGGLRYFFLGSSDAVLAAIRFRMGLEFPSIHICGTYSPPFKPSFTEEENASMVEAVNAAAPDVLWIGMTAPKQEKWLRENAYRLNVPLAAAIGAVFDFYACTKKRSPEWSRRCGLEWLPRFLAEPRRMMRRNLVSTPLFLAIILKEKIRYFVHI